MSERSLLLFKCLADQSRLRIINNLMEGPMYVELLSERLGITSSTVSFHLKKLEEAGLVFSQKQQYYMVYQLNQQIFQVNLINLIQLDYASEVSTDEAHREEQYRKKVINSFFEYEKLRSIPVQEKKKRIVLEELVKRFDYDRNYTEKEVNISIADANDDFCTLRRALIDSGLMKRDNGIYLRVRI